MNFPEKQNIKLTILKNAIKNINFCENSIYRYEWPSK